MQKLAVLFATLASMTFSACTVKGVEAPPLAGPSTLSKDLNLKVSRDILTQNGADSADVIVEAKDPSSRPISNLGLRAEIRINGTALDYGSLNPRQSTTNSSGVATFRYTVPQNPGPGFVPASQVVTIAVGIEGTDFGGETTRTVDILVVPAGVIGNPTLIPRFTVTPSAPLAFDNTTLDASATTNLGTNCGGACFYNWDFGDGTTGTGMIVIHGFRSAGNKTVTLTVTDAAGLRASTFTVVAVGPPTPPTAAFVISPTSGATIGQDVFFNATSTKPVTGRAIVSYAWNFGDGETGSGITVSHRYRATGSYSVVLTVTDEAGGTAQVSQAVAVASGSPTAALTFQPSAPKVGQIVSFDAGTSTAVTGASIVSYTFAWGDNGAPETSNVPQQTHVYGGAGTLVVTLTVTDSLGRTNTKQFPITIAP